jgi:AcrR family transcriptional regulator
MTTKKVTQRDLSAQETRAKIVRAARDVFRAKGFDHASMRDIIGAAQLSGAGVAYHHFKSKEALVQCILEEQVERDFAVLTQKLGPNEDFAPFLHLTGEDLREGQASCGDDIFFDLWPKIVREPVFQPFLAQVREKFDNQFRRALTQCVDAGWLAADLNIEETRQTLVMLGHALRMRFAFFGDEFDFDATATTMRVLYRALLRPTATYPNYQS